MATETFYRGISTLDATATGAGGAMLIANDTQLRDGWFALDEDTHWDDEAASTSTITMAADLTARGLAMLVIFRGRSWSRTAL